MVPENLHDFFVASGSVAGALIGLLFVALSLAGDRLAKAEASGQLHRIRARAALLAFVNALSVSLFALVPGDNVGYVAVPLACAGLVFVAASLLSLVRVGAWHWRVARDAVFLVGLAIIFVYQLMYGLDVLDNAKEADAVSDIASLVVFCFIVGIYRAWELIGGPDIGLRQEVVALVREHIPAEEAHKTAEPHETTEALGGSGAKEAAPAAPEQG